MQSKFSQISEKEFLLKTKSKKTLKKEEGARKVSVVEL